MMVSFVKLKVRWGFCCHSFVRSSGYRGMSHWARMWERLAPGLAQRPFWVQGPACLKMQMQQPSHGVLVREPWRLRHS